MADEAESDNPERGAQLYQFLRVEERRTLATILAGLSQFVLDGSGGRSNFLNVNGLFHLRVRLPMDATAEVFAGRLVALAESAAEPLADPAGLHPLGAVCAGVLGLPDAPQSDRPFLGGLILKYALAEDGAADTALRAEFGAPEQVTPWQDVRQSRVRHWETYEGVALTHSQLIEFKEILASLPQLPIFDHSEGAYVLLSYLHSDQYFANKLAMYLEANNKRVWRDRWIHFGDDLIVREQEGSIDKVSYCIICIGTYTSKKWYRHWANTLLERRRAIKDLGIMPARLPNCDDSVLDEVQELFQHVDLRMNIDDKYALKLLLFGIDGLKLDATQGDDVNLLYERISGPLSVAAKLYSNQLLSENNYNDFQREQLRRIVRED